MRAYMRVWRKWLYGSMCLYYRIKKKVPFKLNIGKNPFIELKMRMCVYFDSIKSSKTSRPEKNRNRTREFMLNEEQSYGSNVNGQLQQCPKKPHKLSRQTKWIHIYRRNRTTHSATADIFSWKQSWIKQKKTPQIHTHIHKHEKNSGARADIKPKL